MTLFVCGTPIGNLEDITFRSLRTLKEADLIAAEDTRETKKLLAHYEIHTPLTSYHKFNIKTKTDHLIRLMQEGKSIALVSDAGMPGISDPGYELIKMSVESGIPVVPIPGPSAFLTALSISGINTDRFSFEGFLPRKRGKKRKVLQKLKEEGRTVILFESPYRVVETLKLILEVYGNCRVAACRELTKKFEEVKRGTVEEVLAHFEKNKPRGELTIVIEKSKL